MTHFFVRMYFGFAYYGSWVLFGVFGLALNMGCAVLLLFPGRRAHGCRIRAVIRWLFALFVRWIHCSGVVKVTWEGFDRHPSPGTVFVANHPTLIDAPVILSRIPDAICIFKPKLMRNPALGPAAIAAEYVAGDAGVDLIRAAADEVARGRSLLIFPEGTRTATGEVLGTLRAGFALIAARAAAPVQLVVLRVSETLLRKRQPWWRLPRVLPAHVVISLDQRWEYDPARHASALTASVTARLQQVAGAPVEAPPWNWKWKR